MMKATLALVLVLGELPKQDEKPLRLGIIGLDTSHVVAFTQILNDEKNPNRVPGAKVVAAFKGGSADIKDSIGRLDGFTKTLQEKWGVEIVDSIPALCEKVDAILLESVDGRPHLEQVRPVFAAKKRVFIDKPMAGTWKDGVEIARLSKESGTPFFSASSIRFYESITKTKADPKLGKIIGCESFGHFSIEPHHPDLFWYGVHAVEGLYSVMGAGCESVTRVTTENCEVVVGKWKDGRIGTFRGFRKGGKEYGVTIFGESGERSSLGVEGKNGYRNLVVEIVKFFQTGTPPVSAEECVEVLAFMQAADLSKARGGAAVRLDELK
jgi:GFO/IDH/MocA oxidoreductase family protein